MTISHFVNEVLENIWAERYRKEGESYEGNLHRVAKFCASNAQEEQDFYELMLSGKFFPGGRTMSNSGIGTRLGLNNCYTSPSIRDDLSSIFDAVKLGALTHQRGGGIGYDFSQLRPSGTPTSNDAIASGPVSFANVFNAQTATILQGNRRGANMGVLNVYHPDIWEFIDAKSHDSATLKYFNLSVMVDDTFMDAALQRRDITLHWPVYDEAGRIIIDPSKWKIKKVVNAGVLWDAITSRAYDNGEPGVFFYNNMNRDNPLWYEETIVSSNPCAEYLSGTVYGSELPSSQYGGACNLGSLMLHKFVKDPFTERATLDEDDLVEAVRTAVRMLDNIIDINSFPDRIYENYQKRYRTIGLGYTGLADALVMLGFKYDSEEARQYVNDLTELIALAAYEASVDLAKEKGSFPGLDKQKYISSGFLQRHISAGNYSDGWRSIADRILEDGIRNGKLLSVAPTGTMSLVYGNNCSSGIEPIFSLEYERKIKMGGQDDVNIKVVQMQDFAYGLYQHMKAVGRKIVEDPPFVTALEMDVSDHIEMLAAIAANVDMSVSKTINVPTDYPFDKCKEIYRKCWSSGIKGCTIFRPNALRQGVLLSTAEERSEKIEPPELGRGDIVCCDDSLVGMKRKLMTGCGSMHLMAWYDPETGDIMETFVGRGSSGGCEKNLTAMTRLISVALRGGVPFDCVLDQLESCGGCGAYQSRRATKRDTSPGSSCATAIAIALKEMQEEIYQDILDDDPTEEAPSEDQTPPSTQQSIQEEIPRCPECGEKISFEGGCNICKACGWSKCG